MKRFWLFLMLMVCSAISSAALAGTYTNGKIEMMLVGRGGSHEQLILKVTGGTVDSFNCTPHPAGYNYILNLDASTELAKVGNQMMVSALMTAYTTGSPVTIYTGAGTCAPNHPQTEEIIYIFMNPLAP